MTLVTFEVTHDDRHGECYDCGRPAAFYLPDAYGVTEQAPTKENIRCGTCAACAAADEGERVLRIPDAACQCSREGA